MEKRTDNAKNPHSLRHTCEKHEWVVFSTAVIEGWLMLQCVKCGTHGTVNEPTADEWSAAFHAPSKPYPWHEQGRVTVQGPGPICVLPKQPGSFCECITSGHVDAPDRFERIVDGILVPDRTLTKADQLDLAELASVALEGGLCSRLLVFFLASMQASSDEKPSGVARHLADRIDRWDAKGLHMSPGLVATILRTWSESPQASDHS